MAIPPTRGVNTEWELRSLGLSKRLYLIDKSRTIAVSAKDAINIGINV